MNKERLLTLANALSHHKGYFDMSSWTTCAMSVASTIPEFQKAGLRCDALGPWSTQEIKQEGKPFSRRFYSFLTIGEFFDIPLSDAESLFGYTISNTERTAKDVAKRIRHYVKTGELSR